MSCISGSHPEIKSRSRGRYQLQGPRPAPLRVSNTSSTIKKPLHSFHPDRSKVDPVVIYLRSPKIIHVRPEEFMSLVQRLTGKDGSMNEKSCVPSSSSPSPPSCEMVGIGESMAAMKTKPLDYGDHDQILGLSPSWLRFLACV